MSSSTGVSVARCSRSCAIARGSPPSTGVSWIVTGPLLDASSTPPSARRSTAAGTGRTSRHLPAERFAPAAWPLAAAARRSASARRARRPCTTRCRPRDLLDAWRDREPRDRHGLDHALRRAQDAVLAVARADQRFAARVDAARDARRRRHQPDLRQRAGHRQIAGVGRGVVLDQEHRRNRDHVGDVHRVHRGHRREHQRDDAGQTPPAEREPTWPSAHGLRSQRQRHVGSIQFAGRSEPSSAISVGPRSPSQCAETIGTA